MMKKKNRAAPRLTVATTTDMDLDMVMTALRMTGRLPCAAPELDVPSHFHRDRLRGVVLEKHPGGWVANVAFHVPPGLPDTMGTPDARPYPTAREAFLAGAAIVCHVVTGSPELPFFPVRDHFILVTYGPS